MWAVSLRFMHLAAGVRFELWHKLRQNQRGSLNLRLKRALAKAKAAAEPGHDSGVVFGSLTSLIGARGRWWKRIEPLRNTLIELLTRTCVGTTYKSEQRASNHRDIVYGLLSMAVDREGLGIDIDYRKSVEEVYTDTARALLHRGHESACLEPAAQGPPRTPFVGAGPVVANQRRIRRTSPLQTVLGRRAAVSSAVTNNISALLVALKRPRSHQPRLLPHRYRRYCR